MNINAQNLDYYQLNQAIRQAEGPVVIDHCLGQRFIGTALGAGRSLTIHGVPGNAMGGYLDGGSIEVFGDVQEATGDTMNAGTIVVHGSAGDATGYSMRGGVILIEGDVGYRAGIHMKSYGSKVPVLIVGGAAGSFLGEYQAGGLILVLGLGCEDCAAPEEGGDDKTPKPPAADLPAVMAALERIEKAQTAQGGQLADLAGKLSAAAGVLAG